MDISTFIQTAFGAIVGGGVVLVTNRLVARAEKRRAIQEWYEQIYVTNGIDPLIVFFKSLQIYFLSLKAHVGEIPPLVRIVEDVPIEALTHLEALLQDDQFMAIIIMVYPALGSDIDEQRYAAGETIFDTLRVLYALRIALLKAIPKVYQKHHGKLEGNLSDYMQQIYATVRDKLIEASEKNEENLTVCEEEKSARVDKL